jgi:nucleoside-diphosphate-sugar epimerase
MRILIAGASGAVGRPLVCRLSEPASGIRADEVARFRASVEGKWRGAGHRRTDTLIADRAFDADARVCALLAAAGKSAVIPPRPNRLTPPDFDWELYNGAPPDRKFLL